MEFNKTKFFEIWSEGYVLQGNSSKAIFHGKFNGNTFKDALIAFKESMNDEYSKKCIDVENSKFWGCKLFDNENDARKSFG